MFCRCKDKYSQGFTPICSASSRIMPAVIPHTKYCSYQTAIPDVNHHGGRYLKGDNDPDVMPGERHFKHRRDFIFTGAIRQIGRDNADHWGYTVASDAIDGRQHADNFNGGRRYSDLFFSFSSAAAIADASVSSTAPPGMPLVQRVYADESNAESATTPVAVDGRWGLTQQPDDDLGFPG